MSHYDRAMSQHTPAPQNPAAESTSFAPTAPAFRKLAAAAKLFLAVFVLIQTAGPVAAQTAAPAATPPPEAGAATPAVAAPAPAQQPDSVGYPPGANAGNETDLTWPVPAKTIENMAATAPPANLYAKPTMDELIQNVAHNKTASNIMWTLVTGYLVMFMQLGFALLETGLCRRKNAAHVMMTNLLVYGTGMIGFWAVGFGIMFGGYANGPVAIGWQPSLGQGMMLLNHEWTPTIFGHPFGLMGTGGFFLNPTVFDSAIFTLFLFQMVFMDTAATIPTGAMAERWKFSNFVIYGLWAGALPYAFFGNWVWGGGWLAQLGMNFGLGHGHVDFAGSSVVHMCGGMMALAGAYVLGPRLGKYSPDGKPRAIPGHNIVFVIVGTLILAFGWFGFNPGSTLAGTDLRIGVIATNTMLASATGMFASYLVMMIRTGKPDPSMICNGMLAGLVAITAPCAFVNSMGAAVIGAIAGVIVVYAVFFVDETLKVDDPVGAVAVHGFNGAWGVLSLGLFANGTYGAGWNGVHKLIKGDTIVTILNDGAASVAKYNELTGSGLTGGYSDMGVTGAFGKMFGAAANDFSQLGAQAIGTAVCFVFVGAFALIWFKLSNLVIPIRSKPGDEISGLDIPEMGVECYPDDQHTSLDSSPVAKS